MVDHITIEIAIGSWIRHIHAAAHDPYNLSAAGERALHGGGIDALGAAGHHRSAAFSQAKAQVHGLGQAIGGGAPRAHHGDGEIGKVRQLAAIIEHQRRIFDGAQLLGIGRILHGEKRDPTIIAAPENFFRDK